MTENRINPVTTATAANSTTPTTAATPWWKRFLPMIVGTILGATCPIWPPILQPVCVGVANVVRTLDLTGGQAPAPAPAPVTVPAEQ